MRHVPSSADLAGKSSDEMAEMLKGLPPKKARKILREHERYVEAELASVRGRRDKLASEQGQQFLNNSGVEISPELKARLTHALDELKVKALQDGLTVDEASTKVAVLFLPNGGEDIATLVPKNELRSFLADYEKYAAEITERGPLDSPLVEEKLILSCMRDLPRGAMRVLFISSELCGTLQVHTSHVAEIKHDADGKEVVRDANLSKDADTPLPMRSSWPFMVDRAPGYSGDEKVADITDQLVKTLKGYPKKQAREILEKVHNEDLVLRDMRAKLLANEATQAENLARFDALIPEFKERWEVVMRRAVKVPLPPSTNTAVNVEALLMAAAYVLEPLNKFEQFADVDKQTVAQYISDLVGVFSYKSPAVRKLLEKTAGCLKGMPYSSHLQDFGVAWMYSGFPKLEVGHKLAASLCMTDVPDDIEVMAPWKAWSLIVPPGLFGEKPGEETYARIWCIGAEPHFFIMNTGDILGPFTRKGWLEMFKDAEKAVSSIGYSIDSLIRGACLALANPNEYKRQTLKEKVAGGIKKPQRDGDPDFSATRFMLSAPVMVDARPHLLDFVSGKSRKPGGGSPTVQFFVRGHWRNQAHGPRLSLRKQMRIEGYWKGPEHGNVLLRNYKVKDDGIDSGTKGKDAEQHSDPGMVQGDSNPVSSG